MLHGWRYCPRCGGDLTPAAGRVDCPRGDFVFYANSQPTGCALCVDARGRLLLARRASSVRHGYWDLPGGFLEEGEEPLDGLVRELREETGLTIRPLDFLGVWVDRYGDDEDAVATLNLYWTASVLAGEPQAADDVSELRWFRLDELPAPDELAFPNVVQAIEAWRSAR